MAVTHRVTPLGDLTAEWAEPQRKKKIGIIFPVVVRASAETSSVLRDSDIWAEGSFPPLSALTLSEAFLALR